jgi:DNA-binding transcriptional LysR family regulator
MITLNHIKEYVILAETLSFSQTAKLAFITQPALSRHIAILEEEMGAKLFVRTTRNVELTTAGKMVYESFLEIQNAFENTKKQAKSLSSGMMGVLRICSPYYWTADHVEPAMLRFLDEHPNSDIQVISRQPLDSMRDMYEGRSDIAVAMYSSKVDESLCSDAVGVERLGVVMHESHPFANRKSVKLDELENTTFVFVGKGITEFDEYRTMVLTLLGKRGITPDYIHYTQQVDTLGMTIQDTLGISIVPYGVRHMDRSYIRVLPLSDSDCEAPMCMYYRRDNKNPLVKQFIRMAKETAKEL